MSDRQATLEGLAERIRERDAIADAWVAKSFTDLILIIELEPGAPLSDEVLSELAEAGLRGANEVYGNDGLSFAGTVDGRERHRFVDVTTRGEHQSYVVS